MTWWLIASLLLCTIEAHAKVSLVPPNYISGEEVSRPVSEEELLQLRQGVRDMFYHGFDNYIRYAFPHDELKPVSASYTDSFAELGNLDMKNLPTSYNGIALTLIDSMSTLAVLGDKENFSKYARWIIENVHFELDVRVNVFETDIRVLGGLLSAHLLAKDEALGLMDEYHDELLYLAYDLGIRMLPAFHSSTSGVPFAWVNLKHGVSANETPEQCVAGVGTLVFEFEVLSHLTGDPIFKDVAYRALQVMWACRSSLGLLGNTLNIKTLQWMNDNSGISAGVDSFYECLLKTYILFGKLKYWNIFKEAYTAVMTHLKQGPWYVEASMINGQPTHLQFNSLQAFWPGMQVLVGDIEEAQETHKAFYSIWKKYKILPERYLLNVNSIHPSEKYYPLRPELIESTFMLHWATSDPYYLEVGRTMYYSLLNFTKTDYGFASVKDVETYQLEDRMNSFFLSETCKYLYLLFDNTTLYHNGNFVFSTEGHLFPVFSVEDVAEDNDHGIDSIYESNRNHLMDDNYYSPMCYSSGGFKNALAKKPTKHTVNNVPALKNATLKIDIAIMCAKVIAIVVYLRAVQKGNAACITSV